MVCAAVGVHVTKGKGGWLVAGGVVSAGCESQLQV